LSKFFFSHLSEFPSPFGISVTFGNVSPLKNTQFCHFHLFTLPLNVMSSCIYSLCPSKTIPCLILHATYRNKRVFPFVTNWADSAPKYSFKQFFFLYVSLFERKTPLSLDVRSVHFATPKVLEHSIRTYESKRLFHNSERNQSDMIVQFLKIYLIVAEGFRTQI